MSSITYTGWVQRVEPEGDGQTFWLEVATETHIERVRFSGTLAQAMGKVGKQITATREMGAIFAAGPTAFQSDVTGALTP